MIFEKINLEEIEFREIMDALDDAINIMKICEDAVDHHDDQPDMEAIEWLMGETTFFMDKLKDRIGSDLRQLWKMKKDSESVKLAK